jgi:hypothetical protein
VKGGPLYPERALEWLEGQELHYSKWEIEDVATADVVVLDHFAVCDHPGGPLLDPPGKKLCKVVADPSETWFLITCILPPFILQAMHYTAAEVAAFKDMGVRCIRADASDKVHRWNFGATPEGQAQLRRECRVGWCRTILTTAPTPNGLPLCR